jgi:dTDP-4-amino-4,6-dideoxygalactose transaminase
MKIFYENLKKSNKFFYKKFSKEIQAHSINGNYILSKNLINFETKFSNYLGVKFCLGVGNGLDALTISLKALNLESNSEVLVASNSYIACIISIINAGLKPVLVEPDIATYNINPKEIQKKITKRTKVIIAVHLYGKSCDMDEILNICKKNNLYLVEDCAQSHGSTYRQKKTGSFGDFGCFSFYPTKLLGCLGDGGAIACRKMKDSINIKKLRNYGSIKKYHNEIIGQNSRLDEIQAIFLNIKLKYLDKIITHKQKLAKIYFENLSDKFILPKIEKEKNDVFHIFNVRHSDRNGLQNYLKNKNITTDIHYPVPPYRQIAFKKFFQEEKFPISDEIHKTTLSLPISYAHNESEIYEVTKVMNKYFS